MKFTGTLTALALVGLFQSALPAHASAQKIHWSPTYSAAIADAEARHTLVMVDVYTSWCEWCKKLDSDVYPQRSVVKAVSQFAPVMINAETEGTQLATRYNVSGYPTILFLDTDGTLLSEITGYEPTDQFASDVNQVAEDQKDYPLLAAKVAANPNDMDDTLSLAQMDVRRMQVPAAEAFIPILTAGGESAKLPSLYDSIGDCLSNQQKWRDAIAAYNQEIASATSTEDIVNGHGGLANCYAQQNDIPDTKTQLEDIINLPNVSSEDKQSAQAELSQINAQTGSGGTQ